MEQPRENYCHLIGLNPMKESTYTNDAIEKKIAAKEAKWTKESADKQNDLERRFQISQNLKLIPDMRKVMKDPILKSNEFDAARKQLKSKASKLNRECVTLHDGTRVLLAGSAESLAKKIQWEGVTKDDLVTVAGLKNSRVPPIISEKALSAYKGIREVMAYTPMDILNDLITNPDLEININPLNEGSSLIQIRSAFDQCEKRVNKVRQEILPNRDSYIQSLRSLKLALNPDKELLDLIKYGKCQRALAPAMRAIEEDYAQMLTREYIDNLLTKYLKNTNADRDMAVTILEEFCVKKKYIANFSNRDSKLIQCPECGALVEGGAHTMFCSVCGFSIKTRCPKCNCEQSSGNRICEKCGFDFHKELDNAKALEETFRKDLESGDVQSAAGDLKKIKNIYPTYPGLEQLSNELKTSQVKYDLAIKTIGQAYSMKRFNDVRIYTENAKGDFPLILSDVEINKKYDEALHMITEADALCMQATNNPDKAAAMALFVSAAEICPDHPTARSKMMEYPPESPADATLQMRDGKAVIKFAIPADRTGMTFCIYRNENSLPTVNDETVPIAEIPGSVFQDKTMDPGVDYYYSVYSKRWGILSREATSCGPAIAFIEVEKVSIVPTEDGLRLTFEKPKGCSRVRIWRKEGTTAAGTGEETEIQYDGGNVIEDRGLKGGVKYHYLFVAEYENKGRIERSMGTDYSCTTEKYPEPIRDMEIKWNRSDGSFTAKWKSKENVRLFASPKKVKLYGRVINIEDIEAWMTEIQPLEIYDDGIKFVLPDGSAQYIYPMIISGKSAVRGTEIMVANLKPFRDVEKRMSGNDCDISMNWPTDAESAIAVIKDSAAADGPDDIHAERITITRDAYNKDKMIRIPMGNSKKRVVTLYAIYDISGEKMKSRGMNIDIYSGHYSKVNYSMKVEKSTRADSKILIEINTDVNITSLPPMVAISVSEGIPLKIDDGESIWSSDGPLPLSYGNAVITFHGKPKQAIEKVRLFFVNEEDYNLFRFIHPIYKER